MRSNKSRSMIVSGVVGGLMLAGVVALGGCATSGRDDNGRHYAVQADVSPELDTLHQRPIDVDNSMFYTWDTNGRMFWADLMRATYNDRPSRLQNVPTRY